MDRDQRSRQQKAGGQAGQTPRRSLGSRVGLKKKAPPAPSRPNPSRAPSDTIHTGQFAQSRAGAKRQTKPAAGGTSGRAASPSRSPQPQNNPQKADYRPNAKRSPRRVTQAELLRLRRRRRLWGALAVLVVLAVGVLLSINLLFKVTAFRVENQDGTAPADLGPYTEEQVLQLLAVQEGDNLFAFSTAAKSTELSAALPYLDEVRVEISMPGTVVVKVRAAVERFAVPYNGSWIIVSESGKVLRIEANQPDGLIRLELDLPAGVDTTPGQFLRMDVPMEETDEETEPSATEEALAGLLPALREEGLLDGVTAITLSRLNEITVLYQDRILIELGTTNNLSYKLRLSAATILDTDGKGLAVTDRGVLDVSYQRSDGEIWAYFSPGEPSSAAPAPDAEPDTDVPTDE